MIIDKIRALKKRRKEKWESLCKKCGLCCYPRSLDIKGKLVIDYNAPCVYLDMEKMTCTVYENRFKVCKNCAKVRLYHALFSPYMPPACGYVEHYRFWRRKKTRN